MTELKAASIDPELGIDIGATAKDYLRDRRLGHFAVHPEETGPVTVFYKFVTCSCHVYFVETHACDNSLKAALMQLKSEFGVEPDKYCRQCDGPYLSEISVVSQESVPEPDNQLVFVSELIW